MYRTTNLHLVGLLSPEIGLLTSSYDAKVPFDIYVPWHQRKDFIQRHKRDRGLEPHNLSLKMGTPHQK